MKQFWLNVIICLINLYVRIRSSPSMMVSSRVTTTTRTPQMQTNISDFLIFKPKYTDRPSSSQSQSENEYEYEDEQNNEPDSNNEIPNSFINENPAELSSPVTAYEDGLYSQQSKQNRTTSQQLPTWNSNNYTMTRMAFTYLFDFVEYFLRPTSSNENIVEKLSTNNVETNDTDENFEEENEEKRLDLQLPDRINEDDEIFSDESETNTENKPTNGSNKTSSNESKTSSFGWQYKDNVCTSKIVYQKEVKIPNRNIILNSCRKKFDSEFCLTKLLARFKEFDLHTAKMCCPNYVLNTTLDQCVANNNKNEINLYDMMKSSLLNINNTVFKYFEKNQNRTNKNMSQLAIEKFRNDFNEIYDELTNDAHNRVNSTRLTIFLWDMALMKKTVMHIISNNDMALIRRVISIIDLIKNHIVRYHQSTHFFYSNSIQLDTLIDRKLRLSNIDLENRSVELVNCREIVVKNQYHKKINASSFEHDYRLLIHKLEDDSLLRPNHRTIYQLLFENLFKTNWSNNYFQIFKKIFLKTSDLLMKELNKSKSSITLFVPTDAAFKSLRANQIESLWSDKMCAYKFVSHNMLNEEVCPLHIGKYATEYSSRSTKAELIVVSENSTTDNVYFNAQKLNLSKWYTASNGFIYRMSTLKLNGIVDFMYDLVNAFRRKFYQPFVNSLEPEWLDIIRNESNNTTLFLPFDSLLNSYNSSSNYTVNSLSIRDYMVTPKVTFYELNDAQVLTSLGNRKYLVTVYQFDNRLPEFMKYIPKRNFNRKAINCHQLEMSDVSACNSQLIVYKYESLFANHQITRLSSGTQSVLDFISNDSELTIFHNLVEHCGHKCKSLFENMTSRSLEPGRSGLQSYKQGYTLVLPVNDYFNKALNNFNKYARNVTLFFKTINLNVFRGTYCGFYLKSNIFIENLMNRQVKAMNVYRRIVKSNVFINELGVVVHKANIF